MDRMKQSMEIIKRNQLESGVIIASQEEGPYHYCFLKDSSFSVYALDLMGQHKEGELFYDWSSRKIVQLENKIRKGIERHQKHEKLLDSDYLHTIYTPDGIEDEQRSNFQLDGYGVWLWGICQHISITKNNKEVYLKSIQLIADYLSCFWTSPCFGCWEEKDDRIHTSTLACIYGGLYEAGQLIPNQGYLEAAEEIKRFILENCVVYGRLSKYAFYDDIDTSLLFVALPFQVLEHDHVIMKKTVQAIEKELLRDQGLYRNQSDSYFGGGRWINMTCWLAWYYKKVGNRQQAEELLGWVEATANEEGAFPEQVIDRVLHEEYLQRWREVFGEIICPSLWSHAMYIIARISE